MTALRSTNLALRFLFELCALAALGYWGFHTGRGIPATLVLGLGAPLLMAIVWGLFAAPRAAVQIPATMRSVLGLIILLLAAACLAAAGHPLLGWVFGLAVALNAGLLYAWKQ